MLTNEEKREALRSTKSGLINAHAEISGVADGLEARLTTESDRAASGEYGAICRILGILEEQIAEVSNQLTKLKK